MISRNTAIALACVVAVALGVGLIAYERKSRRRSRKQGKKQKDDGYRVLGKKQKDDGYRVLPLLNALAYAERPWRMAQGVRPPGEDFAAMVDRAAALPEAEGLSCHARDGYDIAGDVAFVWGLGFRVDSAAECCQACAAHRRTCASPASQGAVFWTTTLPPKPGPSRCGRAQGVCNAWSFCPGSDVAGAASRCFSYSAHNHSRGECWCELALSRDPRAARPRLARPSQRRPPLQALPPTWACVSADPRCGDHVRRLKYEPNERMPIASGPAIPEKMRKAPRHDWPWAVRAQSWPWEVPKQVEWQSGLLAVRGATVWQGTTLPGWHTKFCEGRHGPC